LISRKKRYTTVLVGSRKDSAEKPKGGRGEEDHVERRFRYEVEKQRLDAARNCERLLEEKTDQRGEKRIAKAVV